MAPNATAATGLVLSDQARRYLALQYKVNQTEFMGCMIGERQGNTIVVHRIAPADVDSLQATATHILPRTSCEIAGWSGTVGMIHSHPGAKACWYYFPGTEVATSDQASFLLQPYAVDAIMCGDSLVWMARDAKQHRVALRPDPMPARPVRPAPTRGNQTAGAND